MQALKLIGLTKVVALIGIQQSKGQHEPSDEFEEQLNYFGSVEILHSLLRDYASVEDNWMNPEYEQYDRQVIDSLENDVAQVLENDLLHDPVRHSSSMKVLTNFCGPGNWSINGEITQNPYFNQIDQCCKTHDECPDYIVQRKDYERYPGLPNKPQLFTRLRCSCDAQFFSCLRDVATFFSYTVAWIYSKAQTHCFEYEYPVVECRQFINDGFFSTSRCIEYLVDNSNQKSWQWFHIPYLSANLMCFPKVVYIDKQ